MDRQLNCRYLPVTFQPAYNAILVVREHNLSALIAKRYRHDMADWVANGSLPNAKPRLVR
jgi:hypothetical protein